MQSSIHHTHTHTHTHHPVHAHTHHSPPSQEGGPATRRRLRCTVQTCAPPVPNSHAVRTSRPSPTVENPPSNDEMSKQKRFLLCLSLTSPSSLTKCSRLSVSYHDTQTAFNKRCYTPPLLSVFQFFLFHCHFHQWLVKDPFFTYPHLGDTAYIHKDGMRKEGEKLLCFLSNKRRQQQDSSKKQHEQDFQRDKSMALLLASLLLLGNVPANGERRKKGKVRK